MCGTGEAIPKKDSNPERITVPKAMISSPISTGTIKPQRRVFKLNGGVSVKCIHLSFYYDAAYL
jgi:hypothetical protein